MNDDLNKKGGLLSAFDKAHGKFTKIISGKGYLLTAAILPTMAVMATTPTLTGIGAQFASFALSGIFNNFIPGWGIIAEATFNAGADLAELAIS